MELYQMSVALNTNTIQYILFLVWNEDESASKIE